MKKFLNAALIPVFALGLMGGVASAQDRDERREARQERREARQAEAGAADPAARGRDDGAAVREFRREQWERRNAQVGPAQQAVRERLDEHAEVREARRENRVEERRERRDDRWDDRRDRVEDRREYREERREYRQDRYDDRRFARAWRQSQYRFRAAPYYAPRGYAVRSWRSGEYLPYGYRTRTYVIYQPHQFYLPHPPYGYFWARVGADAVLVREYDGLIVEVVAGLFYW